MRRDTFKIKRTAIRSIAGLAALLIVVGLGVLVFTDNLAAVGAIANIGQNLLQLVGGAAVLGGAALLLSAHTEHGKTVVIQDEGLCVNEGTLIRWQDVEHVKEETFRPVWARDKHRRLVIHFINQDHAQHADERAITDTFDRYNELREHVYRQLAAHGVYSGQHAHSNAKTSTSEHAQVA